MLNPIIPWMGGKRRLAKYILPLFPAHTCYVEPFSGAAALFFMRSTPAKVEVINDINGELINLYRVVQHHLDEFLNQYQWALVSRQTFSWLKNENLETMTDIQRAARFFYLQKTCFGSKIEGQTFGTATTTPSKFHPARIKDDLKRAHKRLENVCIENLDWRQCILKYDRPHTLFYCDPPYYGTAGYGVDFPYSEYEKLADLAYSIQGKMIISINDCPEMRNVFRQQKVRTIEIKYSVGGQSTKATSELVLTNWEPVGGAYS